MARETEKQKNICFTILKVLNPLALFGVAVWAFWRTHGIDCAYEPKRAPKSPYLTQS